MNTKVVITTITMAIFAALQMSQAGAQQKTVRACQEEWRANKAANQAAGITEKAYVAQCRSGGAAAQPAPATSPAQTTATPPGAKTAKACREEWRANKADNQAKGITEKAYVEQCRTGAATAAPPSITAAPPPAVQPTARPASPAPAQSTTPTQPTPSRTAAPPTAAPAPPPTARPAPQPSATTGSNEFSTEAQAKSHCPTDTVVWANLRSHIYHFGDTRYYGTTENGTYMCEKDAIAAGNRAAKNETHP